jgi:orotate phosphoribosyltransferase
METVSARSRLIELLMERSVKTGKFTLASGKESDFFIDCKQAVLSAEGHDAAGQILLEVTAHGFPNVEAVAGVELGGCPLASAVSLLSLKSDFRNLPALYVRKATKDHGTKGRVEGTASTHPAAKVVLLEDVVTTGGSSLRAVEALRDSGFEVLGVVALVNRNEGADEAFDEAALPFFSVLTRDNLAPRKDV